MDISIPVARLPLSPWRAQWATAETYHPEFYLFALVFVLAQWLGLASPKGRAAFAVILGGLLVAMRLRRWRRNRRLVSRNGDNVSLPDPNRCKLYYVGPQDYLDALGRVGDVALEPVVFSGVKAWLYSRQLGRACVLLTLPVSIVCYCLLSILGRQPLVIPSELSEVSVNHGLALIFGMGLSHEIVNLLWRTYLRITPGKLEVLQAKPLGEDLKCLQVFDLRTTLLVLDIWQETLFIMGGEPWPGDREEVPLRGVSDKLLLTHAILRAAASSYQAPILPVTSFLS